MSGKRPVMMGSIADDAGDLLSDETGAETATEPVTKKSKSLETDTAQNDDKRMKYDEVIFALRCYETLHSQLKDNSRFQYDYYSDNLVDVLNKINDITEQAKYCIEESKKIRIDLVRLSDFGPALQRVFDYLPLADRKNMRLVSKDWSRIVTQFDKSFRVWNVSLENLVHRQLPEFFWDSSMPVCLRSTSPTLRDTLTEVQVGVSLAYKIGQLNHRVVGVQLYPNLLDWFKCLSISSLQTFHVNTDGAFVEDQMTLNFNGLTANSLLERSADGLTSLKFGNLSVNEDFPVQIDLPSLRNLEIKNCQGGTLFFSSIFKKSLKCFRLETKHQQSYFLTNIETEMEGLNQIEVHLTDLTFNTKKTELLDSLGLSLQHLISKAPNLEMLNLKRVVMKASVWKSLLSHVPKLKEMILENCRAIGMVDFTCQLLNLTKLSVFQSASLLPALNFSVPLLQDLDVSSEDANAIAPHLQHNTLKKLQISRGSNFPERLIIDHSESLQLLDISGIYLGFKNVLFANNDPHFKAMKQLDLGHGYIVGGGKEVQMLLKACPNLEVLRVSLFLSDQEDKEDGEIFTSRLKKLNVDFECKGSLDMNSILKMCPELREFEARLYKAVFYFDTFLPSLWKVNIRVLRNAWGSSTKFDICQAARNCPKLEDLEIRGGKLEIEISNEDFQLAYLQNLRLEVENVNTDPNIVNVLKRKLPRCINVAESIVQCDYIDDEL